jgi:predicted secreted protein
MHFDVAPETLRAQQQALTDEALAALTARADWIAAALGLTVARIQTLNVGNATQPGGGPRPLFAMRASAEAAAPPPAVAAGDTVIAVTVNAEIALVPGK